METLRNVVRVVAEAPKNILRAFYTVISTNARIRLTEKTHKLKGQLAREAEEIFARDIETNPALLRLPVEEAVQAADVEQINVGLLTGVLVLQRVLPLMQYEYPILGTIATDFSDAPGLFNQEEVTRIVLKPAVQNYDTSLDSAGRPKGWKTVSPAQTVDVAIKLDEYVGVPIVFGVQTMASTLRRLFEETAPQALYALGGYFVNKLTALLTAGNFNAYAATSVVGGATITGSNSIAVTSTANMFPGQEINHITALPPNCYVKKITDSTHAELTQNAIDTASGLTFTLGGGRIPTIYATYAEALADFNMASLGKIGAAFDSNEVPQMDRSVMLNAAYFSRLAQDPTFNTFFAAMRNPEIITRGNLPELQGFTPQKAPWFPGSSNRVGFAYHRAAVVLKTRLPQDFANAVGAMVPGSITTVTAPSGLSVSLVQYVNLQSNYAEWRPEVMLGAAVGDRRAGLVISSA